jgi:flagella basal body P-ring formation protein FlgA
MRIANSLIVVVALLGALGAQAADKVTFREEAFVKGPKVLLGDVASIVGVGAEMLAAIELGDAPQPGAQKRLHTALVETRLRSAGVDVSGIEMHGATSVLATTLSSEISSEEVADSLAEYIRESMPWEADSTRIEVTPPAFAITAPEGLVEFAWAATPDYGYVGAGAFKGEVIVDGRSQRSFNVRAKVEPYVTVMVATRDIMRGMPVGPMDMEPREMLLSSAPEGVVTDPARAVGLVARKTIFPGQFLTLRDLQERVAVERNQLVDVIVKSGSVTLTGRAKATMDGRAGDTIICVIPESKEQIQGVVMPNGVVVVE